MRYYPSLEQSLPQLLAKRFIIPSGLSQIMMMAVLPGSSRVPKTQPLITDKGNCTKESLLTRADYIDFQGTRLKFDQSSQEEYYNTIVSTHILTTEIIDGIEMLTATSRVGATKYELFFPGNGMDGVHLHNVYAKIDQDRDKNYIFFNYPMVGGSKRKLFSVDDLFSVGYEQARMLLDDQNITAKNLSFHGYSLGGGVAIRTARKLIEEGHSIHTLKLDRTFTSLSNVLAAQINHVLSDPKHISKGPFVTSLTTGLLSGIALGVLTTTVLVSSGEIAASSVASMGYVLAYPFQYFEKTAFLAQRLYVLASLLALWTDQGTFLLASVIGAIISTGSMVLGGLIGCCVGALSSLQLLVTHEPVNIPLEGLFSIVLRLACCEMNSVDEIQHLLALPNAKNTVINSINTKDDPVIRDAALNTVLEANKQYNVKLSWFNRGGHTWGDPLEEPIVGNSIRKTK